jgi:hypothetical protein
MYCPIILLFFLQYLIDAAYLISSLSVMSESTQSQIQHHTIFQFSWYCSSHNHHVYFTEKCNWQLKSKCPDFSFLSHCDICANSGSRIESFSTAKTKIQFHPLVFLRRILMLSFHFLLRIPSSHFLRGFPTKNSVCVSCLPIWATYSTICNLVIVVFWIVMPCGLLGGY